MLELHFTINQIHFETNTNNHRALFNVGGKWCASMKRNSNGLVLDSRKSYILCRSEAE